MSSAEAGGGTLRLGEFVVDIPADTPSETVALIESLLGQIDGLLERTAQLHVALESRVAIEQAKGVLCERLRTTPEDAFDVLRAAARRRRVPLHELARTVVTGAGRNNDPLDGS